MTLMENPYRPGAGHMPLHLAGREEEHREFDRLLGQNVILENLVLTGLRGVGKTVLLESFKPRAIANGWLWAGTDMSESASVSEMNLAQRLLADLSVITSTIAVEDAPSGVGFTDRGNAHLTHEVLASVFSDTPGLVSDKIKAVLEFVWRHVQRQEHRRIIFAYDEAQNLSDNHKAGQYPLSVLLDVFQSIQKKGIPFMLVLTGLPTLFPKLVDARTFAERMFRVVVLGRLDEAASRDAITKPLEIAHSPLRLKHESIETIVRESSGYPYFIQFMCREVFDVFIQQLSDDHQPSVPIESIQRKLDTDFFAGRWSKATDRQRELLWVVASLDGRDDEFTIQELVAKSRELLDKPFTSSHASQLLVALANRGLIYKNRFGKYSFAVPLLGDFIRRIYGHQPNNL